MTTTTERFDDDEREREKEAAAQQGGIGGAPTPATLGSGPERHELGLNPRRVPRQGEQQQGRALDPDEVEGKIIGHEFERYAKTIPAEQPKTSAPELPRNLTPNDLVAMPPLYNKTQEELDAEDEERKKRDESSGGEKNQDQGEEEDEDEDEDENKVPVRGEVH